MMANTKPFPRNLKEIVAELRVAVQGSLSARNSRIHVEMPVGFEYGVEGEKAKRKGGAKMINSADVARSNRELARLFVGMFEGTGLVPLVLFPNEKEAAAAKDMWDAPGLEARVQALVPDRAAVAAASEAVAAAPTTKSKAGGGFGGGGGGGFGGGVSGKKGGKKGKAAAKRPPPLTKIPASAEVVCVVAPGESQMRVLQPFCDESGLDKLVICLNARASDEADATTLDGLSDESRRFFADGGDGGFETVFCFLTQPLGVGSAKQEGDPLVLWRSFPSDFQLARKPTIGPPRNLLVRDAGEGRPTVADLKEAIEQEADPGLLGSLLGQ